MSQGFANFLGDLTFWFIVGWMMLSNLRHVLDSRLHNLRMELRPLVRPAILYQVGWVWATQPRILDRAIIMACGVIWWWIVDKDDDDRWKKRRRKLTNRVKELGGRLVVAPTS